MSQRNSRVVFHAGRDEYLVLDADDQVVERAKTLVAATAAAALRDAEQPSPDPPEEPVKRGRRKPLA